ncbi:head-tail connector protein [Nonomuraea sp. NPDC049400]|uniref:head-tail connector protein n=1 Tax=Nonomuraea sp. NPDC049400 TaxID=3364352 RepID=UPI00379C0423
MSTYGVGAVVRLSTSVRDSTQTLVNPASIQLTIQLPDATTAGPFTPINDSTGIYHYDYTTTATGRHIARWATVTPTSNDEEPFEVAPMWGEAGILSLGEAKKQLNIDADDRDYDEEIAGFVRAITEACEKHVGALARTTYTEKHRGGRGMVLLHSPALSLTSVVAIETSGTDQAVGDLDLDQPTGIVQRKDGGWMRGPFRVTYVAGQTQIPAHVRLAALIILQHMWETQRGSMGGVRVGGADEVYDPRFGFSIPRRAQELLGDPPPEIGR